MTEPTKTTDALAVAGSNALATPGEARLYVVFKVGGAEYALPSDIVMQMDAFQGATPVPGAPPFVLGLVQVRGRVVPVVDLRARFGLPAIEHSFDARLVVGEHADRVVALLADSAREVVRIAPGQIKPPPRLVDDGAKGFVKGIAEHEKRMLLVLDFAKVIGEETLDVI